MDPAAEAAGSPRPRVSVIVVVKDGEPHLGRQLAALARQRGAPEFEVLVVDNGSRDGTPELVRRWIASAPTAPVHTALVDAGSKAGIPFARNQGALAARGDVLAFCDADDAVSPTWVRAIADGLTEPGMVGGRNDPVDESGRPLPGVLRPGLGTTTFLPFAGGCNFAATRGCYFAVGGFDESLPPYGFDDVDFSWRVQLAGYPLTYVPEAVVAFTISSKVRAVRKEFFLAKARMAVVRRYPQFDPAPYTLGYCVMDAVVSSALLPVRLIRPRASRTREVRWVVDTVGRLAGYWHYSVRGRDSEPVLVGPDPMAS